METNVLYHNGVDHSKLQWNKQVNFVSCSIIHHNGCILMNFIANYDTQVEEKQRYSCSWKAPKLVLSS